MTRAQAIQEQALLAYARRARWIRQKPASRKLDAMLRAWVASLDNELSAEKSRLWALEQEVRTKRSHVVNRSLELEQDKAFLNSREATIRDRELVLAAEAAL